jgi:DNA uptake protein ComE-like DNA-binding protein
VLNYLALICLSAVTLIQTGWTVRLVVGPLVTDISASQTLQPAPARIDLNRATVEELKTLPGIGPTLATRIVEHRRLHGPFRRPQDVIIIRGMSARRYRQIAHLICSS